MTKFTLIEPAIKTVRNVDCEVMEGAMSAAGLRVNETDHGMLTKHLGIVVDEFGLFAKPETQAYTAIAGRLYAGNAVVYGVDDEGVTVDSMDAHAFATCCVFLPTRELVEKAIRAGLIIRPAMSLNGSVFWQWPNPRPEGMSR